MLDESQTERRLRALTPPDPTARPPAPRAPSAIPTRPMASAAFAHSRIDVGDQCQKVRRPRGAMAVAPAAAGPTPGSRNALEKGRRITQCAGQGRLPAPVWRNNQWRGRGRRRASGRARREQREHGQGAQPGPIRVIAPYPSQRSRPRPMQYTHATVDFRYLAIRKDRDWAG